MHIDLVRPTRYVSDSLRGDLDAFLTLGQFGREAEFPQDVFSEGMSRFPDRIRLALYTLHVVFTAKEDSTAAAALSGFLKHDLQRHQEQLDGGDDMLESSLLNEFERIALLEEIGTRIQELKTHMEKLKVLL
jgi:hypothetical protein